MIKSPLTVDQMNTKTSYYMGVSKNTQHNRRFYYEKEFN